MRKSKNTRALALVLGVGACVLAAACSVETRSGATGSGGPRVPRAMAPSGDIAMAPPARVAPPPIDLTRAGVGVRGEAPVTVFDTRTLTPRVQVRGRWRGPVRDVEAVLQQVPGREAGEEAMRAGRRGGAPNDLSVGGVLDEPRAKPGPLFPGIQQTPWQPPDCTLAVGTNYILETVNMVVAAFLRDGTLVFSQNLDNSGNPGFFEPLGAGNFTFDPKCFYDHIDNRFVIVALETYGTTEAWIDLAVSATDNPNGVWYKYRTNAVVTVSTTTYWVDYPGFGYDKDAYYVNGNLFGLNKNGWAGVLFRVFKKPPVLGGSPAQFTDIRDANAASVQGVHHFGNNQGAFFVSAWSQTQMEVHAIRNAAGSPTLTSTLVTVPAFQYSGGDPPNPGGTISVIDERIFNAVWRDGDLYFGHNSYINATAKNVARWYHLKTNSWPTTGSVTFVEAGDIDPGSDVHSFFPALGVDHCKNVGVVLGTSSSTQNPDVRVTGHLSGDPAGWTGATTTVHTSTTGQNGRWGDYFGVSLDPTDQFTFWYVGEYKDDSGWGTYIGNFKIGCHADYDCNGFVNGEDFDAFSLDFFYGNQAADYNGDGFVNGDDFDAFSWDFFWGC